MKNIKILATESYLPKKEIKSEELEKIYKLESGYIKKRTGINKRYYVEEETMEDTVIKAVNNLVSNFKFNKQEIGLIIVATTTPEKFMPGIANSVQKKLKIKNSNCIDILAGCNGYITAFDIASIYIQLGKVDKALVIGADILSKYTDEKDISTRIILSDGVGVTLLGSCKEEKKYVSDIESIPDEKDILSCEIGKHILMNGKEIYKYAVTEPVKSINRLLKKSSEKIENIKYIIPHQSNKKIIKGITNRLNITEEKMYTNIENVGNTFCASIPIALKDMMDKKLLENGDKIILLGYGGGLNTGSILIEM